MAGLDMAMMIVLGVFAVLIVCEEGCRPDRAAMPDLRRLATNWGLGLANWGLAALVPLGALAAGLASSGGPLSGLSVGAALLPLLLARTLGTYALHRLSHRVPLLWRIHRVHHADPAIDISTGVRSHPVESLLGAAMAATIVWLLAPPLATIVLVDAIILSAIFWTHAAVTLPPRLARLLERLFVTPRLHLIHHSRDPADHDRNFGDFLVLWDWLFGTLKPAREEVIRVGLDGEDAGARSLWYQLALPFRR